ncbi:MAG: glycosyltransferase family 2 protein [Verrucomicrobia bacterium]|nr:glycosyltransferase family 2 protein [Verrucomicrobiota bacterium]
MKLSIVVPAFNEEARLQPMLDSYVAFFAPRFGGEVELLVVVNGSTDRTEQIATEAAGRYPQVRAFIEPRAIGKGGAILLGFQAARGERVGFVDADNSTPPEAFQALVDHLGDAGVIIASRWLPESEVSPRQPLKRRIASRVFNWLVRWMFGLRITDTQCGAKLLNGAALREVMPRLGITRWAFDVDLLFQLRRAGHRILEWPTVWRDAGGSRLKVGQASVEMFVAICRLRLLFSPFRWIVTLYDRTLGRVIRLKG